MTSTRDYQTLDPDFLPTYKILLHFCLKFGTKTNTLNGNLNLNASKMINFVVFFFIIIITIHRTWKLKKFLRQYTVSKSKRKSSKLLFRIFVFIFYCQSSLAQTRFSSWWIGFAAECQPNND